VRDVWLLLSERGWYSRRVGRIDSWLRSGGLVAAWLLAACATGDTPGFSSGNASFGTGGGGEGTAGADASGDDADGTGSGDGTGGESGAGSQTGIDPSADSGGSDDPTADTGVADTGDTGNADGPTCVPSEEVCDGEDNDCDDDIDEDEPGAGEMCSTGLAGPCDEGVTACEAGELVCVQVTTPSAETCDGIDNDCNGQADDGNPQSGSACSTGLPGICDPGTTTCQGGALACNQNQAAGNEVCNNVDDDCDGTADDGNPGGGGACNTGLAGICGAGTLQCQGGLLNCVQNQGAGAEICGNGVDENCNGTPDDGCGCAHDVCVTGAALVNGCSPCVTSICAADAFCCANSWDSLCVGQAGSICGIACQGSCSHSICATGAALVSGCVSCVTSICAVDAFCCSNSWDSLCVSQVSSVCGITC
jgi:Notch-like protein